MKYILENNIAKLRKQRKISISQILEYMKWANRSVLYKKENNISRVSIIEALQLSKFFGVPVEKIFKLKIDKIET